MNRHIVSDANEFVRLAKNDLRNKVNEFLAENEATPSELAYMLGISEGEMEQIINGNGEITLLTLAKILIATGHVLEIKPIEETPFGSYENIPTDTIPPLREMRHAMPPHPMPFREPSMTRRPIFGHPTMGGHTPSTERPNMFGRRSPEEIARDYEERYGRPTPPPQPRRHPLFERREVEAPKPQSPFAEMPRTKLVDIVRKHLWDSEIDLNRATHEQLVSFLDEKDKRINEYKRNTEFENDPKINEFKDRLKKTVKANPHLRNWVKTLLNEED